MRSLPLHAVQTEIRSELCQQSATLLISQGCLTSLWLVPRKFYLLGLVAYSEYVLNYYYLLILTVWPFHHACLNSRRPEKWRFPSTGRIGERWLPSSSWGLKTFWTTNGTGWPCILNRKEYFSQRWRLLLCAICRSMVELAIALFVDASRQCFWNSDPQVECIFSRIYIIIATLFYRWELCALTISLRLQVTFSNPRIERRPKLQRQKIFRNKGAYWLSLSAQTLIWKALYPCRWTHSPYYGDFENHYN